jgi:hypothetical protein
MTRSPQPYSLEKVALHEDGASPKTASSSVNTGYSVWSVPYQMILRSLAKHGDGTHYLTIAFCQWPNNTPTMECDELRSFKLISKYET